MIQRLYVHNFRCLENFDLRLGELPSVLLIGPNGAGKTTVGLAFEVLQRIARGINRVGDLVRPKDLTLGRRDTPARFEIEVILSGLHYRYSVAFEYPSEFRELRVADESLAVGGNPVFTRELAQVRLRRSGPAAEAEFRIDWHVVALPIVQARSSEDPLSIFKTWLANMLLLRPIPRLASGESEQPTLRPDPQVGNVGAWFHGLIANAPSAYSTIKKHLEEVMPDFSEVTNQLVGRENRILKLHFHADQRKAEFAFEDLSDGEKCFMIFALTIAANATYGPLLCFWDEPDNFLAPAEVSQSVLGLRRAFKDSGNLIVTSHNPETISRFSDENTLVLHRNSHLEPTVVRSIGDLRAAGQFEGGLVDALLRGDVDA